MYFIYFSYIEHESIYRQNISICKNKGVQIVHKIQNGSPCPPSLSRSLSLSLSLSEHTLWERGAAMLGRHSNSLWRSPRSEELRPSATARGSHLAPANWRDPEPELPHWSAPQFLTHRHYEVISICCFKAIYCAATGNKYNHPMRQTLPNFYK